MFHDCVSDPSTNTREVNILIPLNLISARSRQRANLADQLLALRAVPVGQLVGCGVVERSAVCGGRGPRVSPSRGSVCPRGEPGVDVGGGGGGAVQAEADVRGGV